MSRGRCRTAVMEASKLILLGRLVANTSPLLDAVSSDAATLQQHLADFIAELSPHCAEQLDTVALQAVDHLTQMLEDLAAIFRSVSQGIEDGQIEEWPSLVGKLKLAKVRDILTYGREIPDRPNHVEFF